MELGSVDEIASLSVPYTILLFVLVLSVVGGIGTMLYVGICAALDAWRLRQSWRLDREAWFAEQARIHRKSKST
jgi:hypothetical protein